MFNIMHLELHLRLRIEIFFKRLNRRLKRKIDDICPNCGSVMTPSLDFNWDGEIFHYDFLCGCGYHRREW